MTKRNFTQKQVEQIIYLYEKELTNAREIGNVFGCSNKPILNILKENGINISLGHRKRLLFRTGKLKPTYKKGLNEKEIIHLYKDKSNSMESVSKIVKCNPSVIKRILIKNGIKILSSKFQNIGKKRPRRTDIDSNLVIELYKKGESSSKQLAKRFKCSDVHIINILKKNNVARYPSGFFNVGKPTWNAGLTKETDERVSIGAGKLIGHECYKDPVRNKKLSEAMKGKPSWCKDLCGEEYLSHFKDKKVWNAGMTHLEDKRILSGEKVHTFNNWSSSEPYDKNFTNAFKNLIRKRDNNTCQLCGIQQKELKRKLSVHHLNYQKLMSTLDNCVSLCDYCHVKTNFNRPHWQSFFQKLLSKKYGYKYEMPMLEIAVPIGENNG